MKARASLMVAFGLWAGASGCMHHDAMPLVAKDDPPPKNKKESDQGKRQPQPATCVAFGDFCERCAADPKRSPTERDRLWDDARKAYQQALQNDPKHLPALKALAHLYNEMDDYSHAVATYQTALKVYPKDKELHYELGMACARHKDWNPALENLRHAVELDPEQRKYAHAYGFCLARAGRYEESLAAFARVEDEGSAHYDLARMLHHMNEDELSKQHLRVALEKKPDLSPAREMLASLEGGASQVQPAGGQTSENDSLQQQKTGRPATSAAAATKSSV